MSEENTYSFAEKIKIISDYVLYHKDAQSIAMYCMMNNINPATFRKYLDYIISNIDKNEIENLLPWSKSLPDSVKQNLKF